MHSVSNTSKHNFFRVYFQTNLFTSRRMSPSGMWRCIERALTDVSEKLIASIFRVEKIRERGTRVSRLLQILY
jgi:hypothetical protein